MQWNERSATWKSLGFRISRIILNQKEWILGGFWHLEDFFKSSEESIKSYPNLLRWKVLRTFPKVLVLQNLSHQNESIFFRLATAQSCAPHGLNKTKECNTSAFSINTSLDTGITNNYRKIIHPNTKKCGNICNEQFYLQTILNDQSVHISEI